MTQKMGGREIIFPDPADDKGGMKKQIIYLSSSNRGDESRALDLLRFTLKAFILWDWQFFHNHPEFSFTLARAFLIIFSMVGVGMRFLVFLEHPYLKLVNLAQLSNFLSLWGLTAFYLDYRKESKWKIFHKQLVKINEMSWAHQRDQHAKIKSMQLALAQELLDHNLWSHRTFRAFFAAMMDDAMEIPENFLFRQKYQQFEVWQRHWFWGSFPGNALMLSWSALARLLLGHHLGFFLCRDEAEVVLENYRKSLLTSQLAEYGTTAQDWSKEVRLTGMDLLADEEKTEKFANFFHGQRK